MTFTVAEKLMLQVFIRNYRVISNTGVVTKFSLCGIYRFFACSTKRNCCRDALCVGCDCLGLVSEELGCRVLLQMCCM